MKVGIASASAASTGTRVAIIALGVSGGIALGAMIDHGQEALAGGSLKRIAHAVEDPLSLFAARSPGERGQGSLYSTKNRVAGKPHERVLSEVRDRAPPPDYGDIFSPAGTASPGAPNNNLIYASAPSGTAPPTGFPHGFPFLPFPAAFDTVSPSGGSAAPGPQQTLASQSMPEVPISEFAAPAPSPGQGSTEIPAPDFSQTPLPSQTDVFPVVPEAPGRPSIVRPSAPPGIIAVPEPGTLVMMLAGLNLLAAAAWAGRRKRFAPPDGA